MASITRRRVAVFALIAVLLCASISGIGAQGVELLSYRPAGGEGPGFEIEIFIPWDASGASSYPDILPEEEGAEFLQTNFSPARKGASAKGLRALVLVSGDWPNAEDPPRFSVRYANGRTLYFPEKTPLSAVEPSARGAGGTPAETRRFPATASASFDRASVAPGGIAFLEIRYSGGNGGRGLTDPAPRVIAGGAEAAQPTRVFGEGDGLILRYPFRAGSSGRLEVSVLGKVLSIPIRDVPNGEAASESPDAALPIDAPGPWRTLSAIALALSLVTAALTALQAFRFGKRKAPVMALGFSASAALLILTAFLAFIAPRMRWHRGIDGEGLPRARAGILVYPAPDRRSRAFALSGAEGKGRILSATVNDSGEEWMLVEYEDGSRGWVPRDGAGPGAVISPGK